jgi:hypothetical protein
VSKSTTNANLIAVGNDDGRAREQLNHGLQHLPKYAGWDGACLIADDAGVAFLAKWRAAGVRKSHVFAFPAAAPRGNGRLPMPAQRFVGRSDAATWEAAHVLLVRVFDAQ